ncbi:MAG: diguanylate cyclase [Myxococcota bacterium]|nr:diguanylate cyclase [Myxococcota bacterium]
MPRVLVVDDSSSIRTLLGQRLRAHGHDVEEAADAETAFERAAANPPDVVVTDLVMTGLSGVQLCRLLRNDPATAHVPVVLLTASGDKRSRFWARSAGAAAYVGKDRVEDLIALLPSLALNSPAQANPTPAQPSRRGLHERISSILDGALFESVLAGEVRTLASAGELTRLFDGLAALLSDVLSYRWLAMAPCRAYAPMFLHAHPDDQERSDLAARALLGVAAARLVHFTGDDRATQGEGPPAQALAVVLGGAEVGHIAVAPTMRGLSRDDQRLLSLVANELGGPMQMAALYEDARRLATTDVLTNLLNRRAFLDAIERERARSDRHTFPLSMLLLDIDHFKRINDGRGHAAGDAVLRGVARVLGSVARKSDFVARWGGEEFVVGLPQTSDAGARVAAERFRRAVAAEPYPVPDAHEPVAVTVSIGAASADAPWSVDRLVGAADAAMYAAKMRGRNRVEVASEGEESVSIQRMRAELRGGVPLGSPRNQ